MYPMKEDFIPPIDAVISKLNSYDDISVKTFATATTLIGEYEDIMRVVKETVEWSYEQFGTTVFVTKLIPGYAPDS